MKTLKKTMIIEKALIKASNIPKGLRSIINDFQKSGLELNDPAQIFIFLINIIVIEYGEDT